MTDFYTLFYVFLAFARIFQATEDSGRQLLLTTATNFEIKAVLSRCSRPTSGDCDRNFQCQSNDTRDAREDELRNCDKKISLVLKIKNRGSTNCRPQYIILDHVFDRGSDRKHKLLNPYVLKVIQRPVYQVYDLVFENVVNSGPSERVLNKDDAGYSGCISTDPLSPTCGSIQSNTNEVPHSAGFCCPCSSPGDVNNNMMLPSDINKEQFPNLEPEMPLAGTNMPDDLPGYNKIDYGPNELTDKGGEMKGNDPAPINAQNIILDNFGSAPRIGRRSAVKGNSGLSVYSHRKRHSNSQDCDSAHCMDFSDIWYSVHKIAHPTIEHALQIQIFEKIGTRENRALWREVTSSGPIISGTSYQRYSSDDGNILAYYTVNKEIESEFALNYQTSRLLIPEVVSRDVKVDDYPELRGGPAEYLVVKEHDIDLSGKTCNKAGVGYEAFVRQPERCENDRNSCFKNQPKQLWQHDHDLEANGQKGCYFLKYYGCLPENPVQMKPCNESSKKSQNKLLYMHYLPSFVSSVKIDFAADVNAVLRADALAMITEAYTETLSPKKVTVTAKILNSGLVSSVFFVQIAACPMEIPASFASITSRPVLIAPQHQHMFTLDIYCELPIKNFYCSLEVFNRKLQLIAVRRIRFQKTDRCVCVWYCQCVCFRADYYGLKCRPLEIEQYHAAGFQGGMPVATQVVNFSDFDDAVSVLFHIILYFCLTLWYMGVIKAVVGCCIMTIGLWGLDKILDLPKKLNRYYEHELKDREVVYNDDGWPIHPDSGKKVNNIAPTTQFAINMVFFFIFPFALLWNLCKSLLAPKYSAEKMFSDLDVCKCKASQISLLKDLSLQNTALHSKGSSKRRCFGSSRQLQGKDTSESGGSQGAGKKSRGCLSFRSKSDNS